MSDDVKLTEPQALMLAALAYATRHEGVEAARPTRPAHLARLRWPDSRGWQHRTRKYGTSDPGAVGGTMPMMAAVVLWKLHGKGLAWMDFETHNWVPTDRGLRWLEAHPTPEPSGRMPARDRSLG